MHNGSLGIWDMRNYKRLFFTTDAHLCKFDEGILCVHSDGDRILTGGADGVIKIYQ